MLSLVGCIILVVVSTAVVWKGSDILESSSENLALYYELPDIVQGAIIAAVGTSFPELASSVLSTLIHGEFELGVATIAGSAIFNILVIPGLSGLFARGTLQANKDLVYKEALFYIISIAVLLIVFAFAVIYNPLEGAYLKGNLTRGLALVPIAFYILYIFIQYQDTMEYRSDKVKSRIKPAKQWGLLGFSLVLIVLGAEGLVQAAIRLGDFFNMPNFLWGLTIIAIGTSISDTFVSVKAARKGKSVTSLANVLGSNIFDLLIAIPAGILIAGSVVIDLARATPLLAILVVFTCVLFVFIRTKLELNRGESVLLLVLYGIFVVFMVLENFGVTSLVF